MTYEEVTQGLFLIHNSTGLLLQLCYRRLLCPKVVNVIVELFAHRYLVGCGVDVPQMVLSGAPQLIQNIISGLI